MFDENLFNTDLKSFIKNNMQGVKDVNEIIYKEIVEKPENIFPLKYDEINQMLNNWRIVSESKQNIYNDCETHKTNPFIFGLNNSSDVSRPFEEIVVEFVYQYAMWFSVGKYISTVRDFQIHLARKLGLSIYKCCSCENDIQVNELECSKCGESLMSCLKKLLVDQPDANLSSECKEEINKNQDTRDDNKNNSQLRRELDDQSGDVIGGDIGENLDCWWRNCGKRNQGNYLYCAFCGIDRAANQERGALIDALLSGGKEQIWICNGCGCFNRDINRKVCCKCYEPRYGLDPTINTAGEKWKCWRELCGNANDGNDKYCTRCGVDKAANQMRGAQINAYKEGREQQIWICSGCEYFNKDLKGDNCEICDVMRYGEDEYEIIPDAKEMPRGAAGELDEWKCSKCECVNNHQLVTCRACGEIKEKLCKICTKPLRVGNEICPGCDVKWQCWFRLCGNMNNGNVDYCKRCGIGKGDIGKYGLPITRWLDGVLEEIWICRTCCFINKGPDYYCKAPRHCYEKRYKVCPHCKYCIEDYCTWCPHCHNRP